LLHCGLSSTAKIQGHPYMVLLQSKKSCLTIKQQIEQVTPQTQNRRACYLPGTAAMIEAASLTLAKRGAMLCLKLL
jgi:hypothetical protein